jgi:hypothetical protein
MEMWQKITAGALMGGVVIGGVIFIPKLVQLNNAAPELDVIPKAMIHKFDPMSGLTIRIDVQLKNPTPAAFKMKYPYVRVTAGDSLLGTSQSVNKDIGMPGYGEANITSIMLQIPMLKLLSLAGTFLKAISANQEVKINIATLTHIDPYWKYDEDKKTWKHMVSLGKKSTVPYTNNQPVTLRKKA